MWVEMIWREVFYFIFKRRIGREYIVFGSYIYIPFFSFTHVLLCHLIWCVVEREIETRSCIVNMRYVILPFSTRYCSPTYTHMSPMDQIRAG